MAKTPKTTIDEELVRQLANLLNETGLSEIEYGLDGLNIRVARQVNVTASAAPATAIPSDGPAPTVVADHPGAVTAPMVGVVYTSSDPETPPFIKVGDAVTEGQTLFLIEAMKVFNPIASPRAGKVTQILVTSETPVEYGEPLAIIE